jgi:hypothetical protein
VSGDCKMSKNSLRKSAMLYGATKVCWSRWSFRGVAFLDNEDCDDDGIDISVGLGELAIVV